MNIEGAIIGILMLFTPGQGEVAVTEKIYNGVVLAGKIIEKTEQGTWGASAHEEGYQGLKDFILKVGGLN